MFPGSRHLVFLLALVLVLTLAWSCNDEIFEGQSGGDCSDSADNDGDGDFDCNDLDGLVKNPRPPAGDVGPPRRWPDSRTFLV